MICAALALLFEASLRATCAQAQGTLPAITSPTKDQVLQGQIAVTGSTGTANFAAAELAFAYSSDSTNSWFVIEALTQPVTDGTLATWDTTQVTDGVYIMRLRVFSSDGAFQDAAVPFEIANYTNPIVATPTAAATTPPALQLPTPLVMPPSRTPLAAPIPTPTQLPPNPASIPTAFVYSDLAKGALGALIAFLVLGTILLRRRP